ncbi:MAG: ImmA/IrrE family metallo-endopeptidase [Treponema sp.]|nr:ImmA/IrrE family metallo-endopeptidase [Treponema sp.]
MTFSDFAKILKVFYSRKASNGSFVLDLFDGCLEDVSKNDESAIFKTEDFNSYNPIKSEETARKYFDGSRKISRQNFEIIAKHFERNRFMDFLKNYILNTDDNFRHLVLKFREYGIDCDENNVEDKCADIFDEIIVSADSEYRKTAERSSKKDDEQEEFLNFAYGIFQKAIEKEDWAFKSPRYKIFRHELYELYQEDTEERFDIAIENYNGENSIPSLKILVKCKKSNSQITKDELVLFWSKVNQVSGCCKAVFVTNKSFEKNALDYAEVMGIGILRIFDEDKIKWLAPRSLYQTMTYLEYEKSEKEMQKAILQENYKILNNFLVGYFHNFHASLASFFRGIFPGYYHSSISNAELYAKADSCSDPEEIPFISKDELKKIASKIRSEIYAENESNIFSIETEALVRYLKSHFNFSVDYPVTEPSCTFPQKVYGLVDYANKKILIYGMNSVDLHLLKFSIAHEISHLVLHKSLLEKSKDSFSYFFQTTKESKRMETQANILASYIVLDDCSLKSEFVKLIYEYHLTCKNGHYLYLDHQPCNKDIFMKITNRLMSVFDVSRELIKFRLVDLGWLATPLRLVFSSNTFA